MKKHLPILLLAGLLGGCNLLSSPSSATPRRTAGAQQYTLAASHWGDVAKIRNEATRLGYEVNRGRMTKTQAAQQLNRFRLNLVGRNSVDDSMYEIYLRSAVQSQQGRITPDQSKVFVRNALQGWQQRWPNMQNRPANPAFTNFLMEVMNMQPLK
ncbi:prokaryotic membrane lipolipid attachment site family protein [Eikenella sp. S3360]|uniref:Prokaryotic membrane lipolipid attachment site family protein n=1 Tax=Eikenella glucosivorans TaxID=2766967 RepID=A0ABS0N8Y8_9NEIS|nr:prokaryotic membrane lipolipid attachment site family protein [Eikenella glucosivorans]MBH5328767.1 prokaryotic membrane lipolipid attachment site family protein [Eikenella glucosivorans]